MEIDALLSKRIRELRKARRHTLEQLAELSGVSRSMISLIERQETSPTATVLDKLAGALGVALSSLFSEDKQELQLSRHADQQLWTDPATGYVRRQVSPRGLSSPLDLIEVSFPPGETVVFEGVSRQVAIHQQIWLLEGEMQISVDAQTWQLLDGDCLAMELGQQIVFHNPGRQPARYVLAQTTSTSTMRKP